MGRHTTRSDRAAATTVADGMPRSQAPGPGGGADRPRNHYVDLLRVVSIGLVVLGHWLMTSLSYHAGHFVQGVVLARIGWGPWLTLGFQVMPVFFLVGGFANATSWAAHRTGGERWDTWLQRRVRRLLWPTTLFVATAFSVVVGCRLGGVDPSDLARGAWAISIQLWFLPVYLLLIALTPLLHAAHRRFGWYVPASFGLCAAAVEVAVLGLGWSWAGWLNYLLVWGAVHQLGFAWQDGSLTRRRFTAAALAGGGALALAGLIGPGPFPVSMIGVAGARIDNSAPPSLALLALAICQTGLVVMAAPRAERLLARPRLRRLVGAGNARVMTIYLWHMVAVVPVAVALYPTRLVAEPIIGTVAWWELRGLWIGLLALLTVPLVEAVGAVERAWGLAVTAPPRPSRAGAAALLAGVAAATFALSQFAMRGFDPSQRLPFVALVVYTAALALIFGSGMPAASRHRVGRRGLWGGSEGILSSR